jgi:hypothetical protein
MSQRYVYLWRNKFLAIDTTNFDEFLERMESAVETLKIWKDNNVILEPHGIDDDYATFVTTDPEFAEREGFCIDPDLFEEDYQTNEEFQEN